MERFALWGTLLNAVGVLLGSLVGVCIRNIKKGQKVSSDPACPPPAPARALSDTVFQGLGLCIMLVGMGGMLQGAVNDRISAANPSLTLPGEQTLVIILSIVFGSMIGHLLDLDCQINRLGSFIEKQTQGKLGNVAQGFVSASLLFCVGSMAIVGSLNSGLTHDHSMLYTKTLLDTVSAVVFASTMGIGVAFSSLLILAYQGSIALLAQWVAPLLSDAVVLTMSVTGSVLILALGLNMLGILKIKVMNFVPAVFLPIALVPLWNAIALLL